MKSWKLANTLETSIKYKDTFFIPNETERNNRKPGDEVQLHFILKNKTRNEPSVERMWVEITEVSDGKDLRYKGMLLNSPVLIKDLKMNDMIEFRADNIARIIIEKDDPRWIDSFEQKALVSKKYYENNGIINFLYREEPVNEKDSGWRMFTGVEDDEYSHDPENIELITVGHLLDKDPSLLEPLKDGYGAAYERDNEQRRWEKIENWLEDDEEEEEDDDEQ
jgi:hypothetical protein